MLDLYEQSENEPGIILDGQQFDLLKSAERKKYVQLALSKLTKEDSLVITLHYIGEKSIAEICEILDAKKSAVKMRLLRGRRQLQAELESLLNTEITNLL